MNEDKCNVDGVLYVSVVETGFFCDTCVAKDNMDLCMDLEGCAMHKSWTLEKE